MRAVATACKAVRRYRRRVTMIGAGAVALTGFGLDSVIELLAAAIVVWQLRGEIAGEERETRAVRLIGVTFFVLALYLAAEGVRDLVTHVRPGQPADEPVRHQ